MENQKNDLTITITSSTALVVILAYITLFAVLRWTGLVTWDWGFASVPAVIAFILFIILDVRITIGIERSER